MKLYEIIDALKSQEYIDFETGEVDVDALNAIKISADEKIENIGCLIKNYKSDIVALKAEETNLKERRERLERQVDGLTRYLEFAMSELQKTKFETTKVVIGFRKSKVVEVPNIEELDKLFLKEKVEYSADKKAIKEAIENGVEVAGATLIERRSINVK